MDEDLEPVEIVCSSPQGSVIELDSMDETLNTSHITLNSKSLTSTELEELELIDSIGKSVRSSPVSHEPSAQLTSFRLRSPAKRLSPLRRKKIQNLLVHQESFNVPNLLLSSPESLYCTARDEELEYEEIVSKIPVKGSNISTVDTNDKYKLRVIPLKRKTEFIEEKEEEEIPQSSEDEGDLSVIEITRTVKKSSSVLQVVSSQGLASSPVKSIPLPILDSVESDTEQQEAEYLSQFNEMSMNQLRQKIIEFGLKPSNSKLKMIQSLKNVYKKIQPETIQKLSQYNLQQDPGFNVIKNSQNLISSDIYNTLNKKLLKIDKKDTIGLRLYEKIYTFQPVHKSELKSFFQKELNDPENNELVLKNWCDWNSICLVDD